MFTKDEYEEGLSLMKEEHQTACKRVWEIMRIEVVGVVTAMKIYIDEVEDECI